VAPARVRHGGARPATSDSSAGSRCRTSRAGPRRVPEVPGHGFGGSRERPRRARLPRYSTHTSSPASAKRNAVTDPPRSRSRRRSRRGRRTMSHEFSLPLHGILRLRGIRVAARHPLSARITQSVTRNCGSWSQGGVRSANKSTPAHQVGRVGGGRGAAGRSLRPPLRRGDDRVGDILSGSP
jgi:hypothetical protein